MIEIPKRSEVIKKQKDEGKLIAAVFPIHYPKELLRAFNIHPVEVWGPPLVDTKTGNAHLQPYICSIVKCGLSFLLDEAIGTVDMVLVPHGCDSLQGLGSLLLDFIKPEKPVMVFYPPRGKRSCDVGFLEKEIKRLYHQLCQLTGYSPDEERLLKEIEKEEALEESLLKLYENRKEVTLSSLEFYRLIRTREYLDADTLMNLLNSVPQKKQTPLTNSKPVILSGIVPEPMDILEKIDEMGAYVAADDFASCRRRVYGKGESRNPFTRMAERILNGPPDSTKGSSFDERIAFIESLIRRCSAKAVIFHNIKFCEAEEFYHPILKRALKEMGVKTVEVEVDLNERMPQQALTRINALIESIE